MRSVLAFYEECCVCKPMLLLLLPWPREHCQRGVAVLSVKHHIRGKHMQAYLPFKRMGATEPMYDCSSVLLSYRLAASAEAAAPAAAQLLLPLLLLPPVLLLPPRLRWTAWTADGLTNGLCG